MNKKETSLSTPAEVALKWWYATGRNQPRADGSCHKDYFLANRTTEWEALEVVLHNELGDRFTHDEVKQLIKRHDKAGMLAQDSIDKAYLVKQERNGNLKEYGTTRGPDKMLEFIDKMNASVTPSSPLHDAYLRGDTWRRRSLRYLDECCLHDGYWICEACGTKHLVVSKSRTIQVHHNWAVNASDGCEPNVALLAVCETPCHPTVDFLRRLQGGKLSEEQLNDATRRLLGADE